MAVQIAVNAKMRRTGICGAAETLLVDRAVAATHLVPILDALAKAGCEIRATDEVRAVFPNAVAATDADWTTEYLDAIISVKLVDGVGEAIEHIETFSSHHTEAIVAEDAERRSSASSTRSIRRSCCTTPRPSSPTAASSAWAPRSASPPARCMRAARSASSS